MLICTTCGSASDSGRFCSSCGGALVMDAGLTAGATHDSPPPPPVKRPASSKARTPSGGLSSEGRFVPGVLAQRYRIVAVLGKGGMGEVYRADDLTLAQPVALKFLPEKTAGDEDALARFRNEVRTARRVSHLNVCRVYDVGEVEGLTFLSMEYVDGEDLASLLRRIGRLAGDKALEIARQLCAGIAAAHREGVLHRDLKPANVMLDGRGRAVITDFGLASLAEQIEGHDVRSGTPAYMAPEQLQGREVTVKSDIYSLGLVLYEMFTGKRAYEADTLAELVKVRAEKPLPPSTWVRDLNPAVQRVILRCLDPDPLRRPDSALAVAAALPGGDPLAAALAAGETPSPEIVAAAGEKEGIAPRAAVAGLAAVFAGMIIVVYIGLQVSGLRMMHGILAPDVLAANAQEIIRSLGYSGQAVDHASDFDYDTDFTDYVHSHELPRPNWNQVFAAQPQVLRLKYRLSPVYLDATGFVGDEFTPGVVRFNDPPETQAGMIGVVVDAQDRLVYFQAIPPEVDPNPPRGKPADWKPLFAAAGLDLTQFHPAQPQWFSLAGFDERAAWTGTWPGTHFPMRVEAAAWRGRPVFFQEVGPWTTPDRSQQTNTNAGREAGDAIYTLVLILILLAGIWLARRNYRRGKADLHGAFKLARAVFALEIAVFLCLFHYTPTKAALGRLSLALSTGLFMSAAIWVLYLALEPYVRRHWPQAIISWSRLTTGRVRDPLVGRDVLWGVMLGVLWGVVISVNWLMLKREGATPQLFDTAFLMGGRQAVGFWLANIVDSISATLQFFLLLFLLKVVLRNIWLAAAVFVAIFTATHTLPSDHPQIVVWTWIVVFAIAAFAITRFGLITLAVAIFTADVVLNVPFTLDFSRWYATTAMAVLLSFLAIAAWGFHTSLGGQKLFKNDLFD
jgi:cbb3-type cytochrome oxidase subunit 3/predicted Ser/Thr protein kinase